MPKSNLSMIRTLMFAINTHGGRVLLDRVQFFSEEQHRPVTLYKVCEVRDGHKRALFDTASQIQVVSFLRDYWFVMDGKDLPTGQKEWNDIRERKQFDWSEALRLHEELEKKKHYVDY